MAYLRAKITRFFEKETTTSRYIAGLDMSQTVGSLVPEILEPDERAESFDIKCLYYGEILDLNKKLSDCDLDSYSILHFIIKRVVTIPDMKVQSPSPSKIRLICSLFPRLKPADYLENILHALTDRDFIDLVVRSNPALGVDLTAYIILLNRRLLHSLLTDPNAVEKLILLHPSLAIAFHSAFKHASGQYPGPSSAQRTIWHRACEPVDPQALPEEFSINRAEPDEEDEDESDDDSAMLDADVPVRRVPPVSPEALSAAIAAARASTRPSSSNIRQEVTPSSVVTDNSPAAAPQTGSAVSRDWTQQLAQLRDMGVTDELAARQALEAAGGDVNLALMFLFG